MRFPCFVHDLECWCNFDLANLLIIIRSFESLLYSSAVIFSAFACVLSGWLMLCLLNCKLWAACSFSFSKDEESVLRLSVQVHLFRVHQSSGRRRVEAG